MARQSSHRSDADEPDEVSSNTDATAEETLPDEPSDHLETEAAADATPDRSLWEDLQIHPVEIALPSGAGFTLRAYRMSDQITPTDIEDREVDDPFAARRRAATADAETEQLDDDFPAELAEAEAEADEARSAQRGRDTDELDDRDPDEPDPADFEDEEAEAVAEAELAEKPEPEEVPVFLSHRGRLLLFKTPESLVSFIRSGAPNDLTQLDSWDRLVDRVEPADIAPLDDDSYELDLVVENLRGGHDTWDANLLIKAGEAARDLAYALRLPSVLDMLSVGSSLDDLDEALRSTAKGGFNGFRGRRRLKKIGAQTASLGWRTIIGKISAVVDWRD